MNNLFYKIIVIFQVLFFTAGESYSQIWIWADNTGCGIKNLNVLPNDDGTFFYYGTYKDSILLGSQTFYSQNTGFDMILAKMDVSGNFIWGKSFGGNDNYNLGSNSTLEGFGLCKDSHGNLILAGSFADTFIVNVDTLISNRNWQDGFLAKCDSDGNFLWIRHLSARAAEAFNNPILDANDNIFVGGGYTDYDPIDTLIYLVHEIPTDTFFIPFTGNVDGFLFRFDPDGHPLWLDYWGGPSNDYPDNYFMDNSGSIYIAQRFDSTTFDGNDTLHAIGYADELIRKYDSNGIRKWVRQYGNVNYDVFKILNIVDNKLFIYGLIDSITTIDNVTINSFGQQDVFCATLDTSGRLISIKNFGAPGATVSCYYHADVNADGVFYLPLYVYTDTVLFDTIPIYPNNYLSNGIVILDSVFRAKKIIHWSEIADTLMFKNIYCTNSGAIVLGDFVNTAIFSGNTIYSDSLCNQNFIASLNFTTSIDELQVKKKFKIFPDPSDGNFNIEMYSEKTEKANLRIFSIIGYELMNENLQLNQGLNLFSISEKELILTGIYFVELNNNESVRITEKIIIQ